jgi:hypothetical protein
MDENLSPEQQDPSEKPVFGKVLGVRFEVLPANHLAAPFQSGKILFLGTDGSYLYGSCGAVEGDFYG